MNGKEKDRARCISTVTQRDGQLASLNGTKHSWGRTSLNLWRDLLSHLNTKYVEFFLLICNLGRWFGFHLLMWRGNVILLQQFHYWIKHRLYVCLFFHVPELILHCCRGYMTWDVTSAKHLQLKLMDKLCYVTERLFSLCSLDIDLQIKEKKYFAKCQRARKIDMCSTRSAM